MLRALPVQAKAFDDVSKQNGLRRISVPPRLVNHNASSREINIEISLREYADVEDLHFFDLLLQVAFEDVIVEIDRLCAISIPFPQIVVQDLYISVLGYSVMKLLLEGVFLLLAAVAVPLLAIRRLCFLFLSFCCADLL